jgi:hypothetical protein
VRSLIMTGLGSLLLLGAVAFGQDTTDLDHNQAPTTTDGQLQAGAQAPALNLFDLKGQVFVLEFINPRDEKWLELHKNRAVRSDGDLKETYDKYKEDGVIWLAVCPYQAADATATGDQHMARGDRGQLCREVKELGLDFPVLFDEGGRIAQSFNVTALPHVVVIDKQGRIAFTQRLQSQDGEMVGTLDFDRAIGQAINATGDASTTLPAGAPRENEPARIEGGVQVGPEADGDGVDVEGDVDTNIDDDDHDHDHDMDDLDDDR